MGDEGIERKSGRMDEEQRRGGGSDDHALAWLPLSPLRNGISNELDGYWPSVFGSPSSTVLEPIELLPFGTLSAAGNAFALEFNNANVPAQESRDLDLLNPTESNVNALQDRRTALDDLDEYLLRVSYYIGEGTSKFYSMMNVNDLMINGVASSENQEASVFPEYRAQRTIDLQKWRNAMKARFLSPGVHRPGANVRTCPERLMLNILRLAAKNKPIEEEEEIGVAYYQCSICYHVAKDPVITPCGHLFCWPCLYRWLHDHSTESECPVCKGKVLEVNVTPIYGRGCTEATEEIKGEETSAMKVPPRPKAHRIELSGQKRRSALFVPVELVRASARSRDEEEQVPASRRPNHESDTLANLRRIIQALRTIESNTAEGASPVGSTSNAAANDTAPGSNDGLRRSARLSIARERNSNRSSEEHRHRRARTT